MMEFSNKWSIFLSVRANDIDKSSNRRYSLTLQDLIGGESESNEALYDAKNTKSNTKTNYIKTLCSGKLPKSNQHRSLGITYKPLDNNLAGKFPDMSVPATPDIVKLIQEHELPAIPGQSAREIKMVGNLICYNEWTPKYEKIPDSDDVVSKEAHLKHFIQEAESLRTIINRLIDSVYKFTAIRDGKIYFDDNNQNKIMVDLNKLIPNLSDKLSVKSINDLESLIEFVDHNSLAPYHAPVFYKKEDNVYLPVMVHSGEVTGFAITGDGDMEHIGIIYGLPDSAHISYDSKKVSPKEFLTGIKDLIKELEKDKFDREFISEVKNTYDFYSKNPEQLRGIGVSSIYSLVRQYNFYHMLLLHGPEDLHPSSNPERFGGILSRWRDNFVMTGDEKAYLDFILHDPTILEKQEIGVHPQWLRHRTEEEKDRDGGVDLSEQWLDAIAIMALNRYNRGGRKEADKYVNGLIKRIESIVRPGNTNAIAVERIRAKTNEVLPKSQAWSGMLCFSNCAELKADVNNERDELYRKYESITRQVIDIMNNGSDANLNVRATSKVGM